MEQLVSFCLKSRDFRQRQRALTACVKPVAFYQCECSECKKMFKLVRAPTKWAVNQSKYLEKPTKKADGTTCLVLPKIAGFQAETTCSNGLC